MKTLNLKKIIPSLTIALTMAGSSFSTWAGNSATGQGAFVAGGDSNVALGDYSAASAGYGNSSNGSGATVNGGYKNTASVLNASVSGGAENKASGNGSAIAGGVENSASGNGSTISGGIQNFASGWGSIVPGGFSNRALGDYSFAAGVSALARKTDPGTFVWADSATLIDAGKGVFESSGPNQFLIRANGGFALNATPINSNVEMTLVSNNGGDDTANLFMRQSNSNAGILMSIGQAQGKNDAAFILQQYNGNDYKTLLMTDNSGNFAVTSEAYKPGGGAWAAPSDARLKTNIQPLEHALDQVLNLRGVSFEYANPDAKLHPAGTHIGFIAQEVQSVFPNWVGQSPDGYLTVGPKGFEALTVEALRELKTALDKQTEINRNLANDVAELHRQMASLTALSTAANQ